MSIHIRRGLIYLFPQNSSFLCKSRVFFSLYFSTSRGKLPPSTPSVSECLMQKYHFHPKAASRFASALTSLKNPKKSSLILSFLKESGFSAAQMQKILKSWPELLSVNLEKIVKPKIKILQEFGLSANDIVDIILKDPSILHSSANKRFIPSLTVLKGLLGCTAEMAKFLKISGWYLKSDLDNTLVPNIKLLHSCGIPMEKINWLMYYFPRFMLRKQETMKKLVEKADRLGGDRSSKMFIHVVLIASSMSNETLELKKKTFRDLGFSEDDILRVFRTQPQVFAISEKKIKKVKEVILATGKYDLSCIVNNPTSLTRSIEKRYKPRFQVLEILEGKNLITNWPGFTTLFKMTDKNFFEKFVHPYSEEVGEVYMTKGGLSGKRRV
ncbi:hypothetical protein Salat_0581300 [Sesamum alatum]|uniref:Uncharacterized protein n=1 Tax=Sesamum alatum TaxID=300844 RepID=A0AAE1YPW8_9LAMI|nr:hypothetical protein Salat_0581300 [Sesamum alatum]